MNDIPIQSNPAPTVNVYKRIFILFAIIGFILALTGIFIYGYTQGWFEFASGKKVVLRDVDYIFTIKDSKTNSILYNVHYTLYRNISGTWFQNTKATFQGENNVLKLTENNTYRIFLNHDDYYSKYFDFKINPSEENLKREIFLNKKGNVTVQLQGIFANNTKQTLRIYIQTDNYLYHPNICLAWSFNFINLNISKTEAQPPTELISSIDKCFKMAYELNTINDTLINDFIVANSLNKDFITIEKHNFNNITFIKQILNEGVLTFDYNITTFYIQPYDEIKLWLYDEDLVDMGNGEFEYRFQTNNNEDIGIKNIKITKT